MKENSPNNDLNKDKQNEMQKKKIRAASLSKPVFAYLVLKLIEDNKFDDKAKPGLGKFMLPKPLKEFNLDTPLYEVFPEMPPDPTTSVKSIHETPTLKPGKQ